MAKLTAWIADCHVQDRDVQGSETPQDYTCQAAVWADSFDSFRTGLNAHLGTAPYKLLWIEECHEAVEYIKRHGQQVRIGRLARAVYAHHLVELGPLTLKGDAPADAPVAQVTFKEALLALDYKTAPVFAVLDGAQFDNLPKALFDGDFISRPLYLDRGENDPEQTVTAPHMVTLDERTQLVTGRSYEDTLEALLSLVGEKPAAVFWQCPDGGEALYKHLRGINMVLYPDEELQNSEETTQNKLVNGILEEAPDTHTMVLFRHADANVMAQILDAVNDTEQSRLFGCASRMLFAPEAVWEKSPEYSDVLRSDQLPHPERGMLKFSWPTLQKLLRRHSNIFALEITGFLKECCPQYCDELNDQELGQFVDASIKSGEKIGLKSQLGIGYWAFLLLLTNGEAENEPDIMLALRNRKTDPDEMIGVIVDQMRHEI